jgi:hypothetical protein
MSPFPRSERSNPSRPKGRGAAFNSTNRQTCSNGKLIPSRAGWSVDSVGGKRRYLDLLDPDVRAAIHGETDSVALLRKYGQDYARGAAVSGLARQR